MSQSVPINEWILFYVTGLTAPHSTNWTHFLFETGVPLKFKHWTVKPHAYRIEHRFAKKAYEYVNHEVRILAFGKPVLTG